MATLGADVFWCGFYGVGIIGTLLVYGLLQERIMAMPYGSEGVMFKDSVFLVFCNRVVAVLFALTMVLVRGEPWANQAPLWKYVAISFSNVYASTCQYEALKYVSFAVQMLGKSFKMLPVMVWGILVNSKTYALGDWLIALAVTGGVTEFLMTGPIESSSETANSTYGLLLLLGFLALDGFTSTFQEKLFKEHKVSKYNQMLYINLGSASISLATAMVTGGFFRSFYFLGAHPDFALDVTMLSASAVAGQWFILSQVKDFGALVFAATMNVRQVVSILVSYITYGHSITHLQILGLLLVFFGLFYKSYAGLHTKNEKAKTDESTPISIEPPKANV